MKHKDIIVRVPTDALFLIDKLEKAGFSAFVVGGCVRDSILGKTPKDWDICTNATPTQMQEVFAGFKVIETGLKHGTLTVVLNEENYEITTYRVDGEYSDGRRPDSVSFTSNLKEDLSRRDFTINALAYSDRTGVIDFFGGLKDIEMKRIKAVGDPNKRFEEDGLRIMRGMRFASILGFEIEKHTANAMRDNKYRLANVSAERKNVELTKMLGGKRVFLILRYFKDIIAEIIPEFEPTFGFEQHNPFHKYDVWEHTIRAVALVPDDEILVRLAAFFHDIGKPFSFVRGEDGIGHFYGHPDVSATMAEKIMKDLHYSNTEIETVVTLVKYHDVTFEPTKRFVMRMCNKIGVENLKLLAHLRAADAKAQNGVGGVGDRITKLVKVLEMLKTIDLEEHCFTLKQLAMNGTILQQELGVKPGKEMGSILNTLLTAVIDGEVENTKEALVTFCVSKSLV